MRNGNRVFRGWSKVSRMRLEYQPGPRSFLHLSSRFGSSHHASSDQDGPESLSKDSEYVSDAAGKRKPNGFAIGPTIRHRSKMEIYRETECDVLHVPEVGLRL